MFKHFVSYKTYISHPANHTWLYPSLRNSCDQMHKSLLAIACCVLVMIGCHKEDNASLLPPGPACRIIGWQDTTFFDSLRHNVFTYNQYGNPVLIESEYCCTGTEPQFFYYDSQQRLVTDSMLFVYHYLYNDDDTMPYGAMEIFPYGERYIIIYTYDNKQRITKVVADYIPTGFPEIDTTREQHIEKTYNYDSRGNLVNDNIKSEDYTDKPSLYRTNKWWPLLHFDFSVNSRNIGSDYNECGYPKKVDEFVFRGLGQGMVQYETY